jgi:methyl-accepting chemotaxis protein
MLGIFQRSLGAKLIFWVVFTLILTLGFTTWVNITYQAKSSKAQIEESAALTVHTMLETLKALMLTGQQDLVQQTIAAVGEDIAGLSIVDWEGVIRKSSNEALIGKKFQVEGFDIRQSLKGKEQAGFRRTKQGRMVYTQLLPVKAKPECYQCHESTLSVIGAIQADLDWASAQARINQVRNSNLLSSLLVLMIIIGLIVVMLWVMLTKPIDKLIVKAEALGSRAGDLTQKITVSSKDEVGRLAGAFNKIIDSLHDMVLKIRNSSERVASSAQELSSSAEEMNASTQEITAATQQISKAIVSQSEQTEGTYEVTKQMSDSLKRVVANAQSVAAGTEQAAKRADTGKSAVEDTVAKINQLSDTVSEATKVIQTLGERSQQIGEITETITSIADQTNLLALNAAIEAARAGEAGRGFAVVAEEVRKLAEGSAEAVRKIGGLIKSIQSETELAVTSIRTSFEGAQEGKALVQKVAGILIEISKTIQETAGMASAISETTGEQLKSTERVTSAINEIASASKETASTSEQITSSTEEQTASMQQMSSSAQELARLAAELSALVGQFKLKEDVQESPVKSKDIK